MIDSTEILQLLAGVLVATVIITVALIWALVAIHSRELEHKEIMGKYDQATPKAKKSDGEGHY